MRYDLLSRIFHWTLALLIPLVFIGALLREQMPRGDGRAIVLALHIFAGMAILLLALGRSAWAWRRPAVAPWYPAGRLAAITASVHRLLYTLMIAAPAAGWWLYSVRGRPSSLFGIAMPAFTGKDDSLRRLIGDVHEYLAYALIGLVLLHVAAALYHRFVLKDGLFSRMTGGSAAGQG